jgi:hypothetical protein
MEANVRISGISPSVYFTVLCLGAYFWRLVTVEDVGLVWLRTRAGFVENAMPPDRGLHCCPPHLCVSSAPLGDVNQH